MSSTEHVILRELLAHSDRWVSGAALAAQLHMTRVSVWEHIEKLRAQGFVFEAQRTRGYRLAAAPSAPHAALIDLQLPVRRKGFSLVVLDETESTNDIAARELAAGRTAPFAIAARRQTKGRGRLGRAWHSEANGNLYLSFGFRPSVSPDRMQTFTLWMGLSLCELVENFSRVRPGLKWPNDILFGERKAGGLLTEARIDADHIRDLVFGAGLNVNSPTAAWPDDLSRRAVSLAEVAGEPVDFNRFTAALIGRVLLAYEKFVEGEHLKTFGDLWQRYDVLRGRTVTVIEGSRRHTGAITGIDDEGALLMRTESETTQRFRAGEVTLEKST